MSLALFMIFSAPVVLRGVVVDSSGRGPLVRSDGLDALDGDQPVVPLLGEVGGVVEPGDGPAEPDDVQDDVQQVGLNWDLSTTAAPSYGQDIADDDYAGDANLPVMPEEEGTISSQSQDGGAAALLAEPQHVLAWSRKIRAKIIFSTGLQVPSAMVFKNGHMFITEFGRWNCSSSSNSSNRTCVLRGSRILRVPPGRSRGVVAYIGSLHGPSSVTFYKGYMFIADSGNHRIVMAKPRFGKYEFHAAFGRSKDSVIKARPTHLRRPSAVVFDQDRMFIADTGNHRIVMLASGQSTGKKVFGDGVGEGLNQLNEPVSIVSCQGSMYIADRRNHRILRISPGSMTGSIAFGGRGQGNATNQLHVPHSVDIVNGKMYISDSGNHRVIITHPGSQEAKRILGGTGVAEGTFRMRLPTSTAVHGGSLFVVERGNRRILKITES